MMANKKKSTEVVLEGYTSERRDMIGSMAVILNKSGNSLRSVQAKTPKSLELITHRS